MILPFLSPWNELINKLNPKVVFDMKEISEGLQFISVDKFR